MIDEADAAARAGRYRETIAGGETVRAFVPADLPPEPPIDVLSLLEPFARAQSAIGRLDGITTLLPGDDLFLYMYVRKEAVLSSQIEGTQSTLNDLLRFESDATSGQPIDDIREVSNYVDAMLYGLDRLETLPLSLRLMREMHARLLDSGRGAAKSPGEFRTTQNWIGGMRPVNAQFVPPSPDDMLQCLDTFERFIHEQESRLPTLIKAGLLHVQFETIHPFLDGNGRLGRLLVTLFLCMQGEMKRPLLYLSLYLKTHRERYYALLQDVREYGLWEDWLTFFLEGIAETANQAFDAANRIVRLFEADRAAIRNNDDRVGSVLRVHEAMQRLPFANTKQLRRATGLSAPPINDALKVLERLEIVSEVSGRQRGRVYRYDAFMDILSEGTTPL
ncbi:Fic family protein [Salinisphaera sp. RV14]|uniref:Fic family protein n=1 Tax=unclassified Salinisphaera TaxID=2649847 RepID=UPI003F84D829